MPATPAATPVATTRIQTAAPKVRRPPPRGSFGCDGERATLNRSPAAAVRGVDAACPTRFSLSHLRSSFLARPLLSMRNEPRQPIIDPRNEHCDTLAPWSEKKGRAPRGLRIP
ncbi:MAG: hypothetical protein LC659_14825, partial [Myxococcales bacterium]|nr:hypothetical protein [Myxococcales bacterium]